MRLWDDMLRVGRGATTAVDRARFEDTASTFPFINSTIDSQNQQSSNRSNYIESFLLAINITYSMLEVLQLYHPHLSSPSTPISPSSLLKLLERPSYPTGDFQSMSKTKMMRPR